MKGREICIVCIAYIDIIVYCISLYIVYLLYRSESIHKIYLQNKPKIEIK